MGYLLRLEGADVEFRALVGSRWEANARGRGLVAGAPARAESSHAPEGKSVFDGFASFH